MTLPDIPADVEPDTKDWTWVLDEPCPECGYVAAAVDRADLGRLIRSDAAGWATVLTVPSATERPDAVTWSPAEYACHVRDVHRIFSRRLALLLEEDVPTFADWDQDETAVADRYDLQDPAVVGPELIEAAETIAAQYDALVDAPEQTWARRGLRSNGSEFTVDTLARYQLHDLVHHAHDVRASAKRATVAAYDDRAESYSDATWELNVELTAELDAFAAAVGAGGAVLEIGSAGGRDALQLEARGLTVRRTDVTPAFVELMRSRGFEADLLDPLTHDLAGPYDGVWASACLLHVARTDLPTVLRRLAEATRTGGALAMSVKEGDGEEWSTHGTIEAPRLFTYWREEPLLEVVGNAGWTVDRSDRGTGSGGQSWITIRASRSPV